MLHEDMLLTKAKILKELKSTVFIDLNYLKIHNWVAFPFDSGLHFSEEEIHQLVHFANQNNFDHYNAFAIEGLEPEMEFLKIKSDLLSLKDYNQNFGSFNYIFFPPYASFLVICRSSDDFNIFIGKESTSDEIFHLNTVKAKSNFERFIQEVSTIQDFKIYLTRIYDYYFPSTPN